jgi:uncharacterized protein (TIGR02646 family)
VIPVQQQPPPSGFYRNVREPARRWLKDSNMPLSGPVPKDRELKAFWTECLDDLYAAYDGVCAYVSIRINRVTGARSTDHFIAKSSAIEHAYRWSNYRLACQKMNSRKGTFDALLDPFEIGERTFVLNLLDGSIKPSPDLDEETRKRAQDTIDRLGLDDEEDCRRQRREYLTNYYQ